MIPQCCCMLADRWSQLWHAPAHHSLIPTVIAPIHVLQIKITQPGQIYRLGKGIGAVKVIGLADTGRKADATAGVIYDDCYQEGACSGPL